MIIKDYYEEIAKNDFHNVSDTVKICYDTDILLREFILPMCNNQTVNISYLSDTEKENILSKVSATGENVVKSFILPSDILFSKTLPLKSVEIINDDGDFILSFSVRIRNNYEKIIDKIMENGDGAREVIGIVEYTKNLKDKNAIGVLEIGYGFSGIMWSFLPKDMDDLLMGLRYFKDDIMNTISTGNEQLQDMLITWYAIQILLLNPTTQILFSNPKITRFSIKQKSGKDNSRKRKIEYHRTYTIKKDDLEKKIYGGDHKINRKCLCWYVIGHWREYKNGKKIFVQGYWKGALRETKKNYDEGRERVVI